MSKKIIFKIDAEGNVRIAKVEGYGKNCLEATAKIEKALGKTEDSSRRMTEEYDIDTELEGENSEHIEL